jgi:hypothetical protein
MMKHLLLTSVFAMAFSVQLMAQCTPSTACANGICPDTIVNLTAANNGQAYSDFLTVVVPADTTVFGFPITIDSLVVDSISGCPAGINWTTNSSYNGWLGGTKGCVVFAGLPTTSGTYPLNIYVRLLTAVVDYPYTYTGYKIVVSGSSGVSLENFNENDFVLLQNMPNPFSGKTQIRFNSPEAATVQFTVMNLLGEVVCSYPVNAQKGVTSLDFNATDVPSGIYLYQVSDGKQTCSSRMIVSH